MKPIEQQTHVDAYVLFKLDPTGKFCIESASATEQGDLGIGCYSDMKKAQYQQMILALKNIPVQIYHLEHPL
jgi:hypothetical protein